MINDAVLKAVTYYFFVNKDGIFFAQCSCLFELFLIGRGNLDQMEEKYEITNDK